MAALFISHSSKDDAKATALEAWLRANGFTDIFADHSSIAGGDKWREALRAASGACRVVLCLVTDNWLASLECFNEFGAAWYMGKRIIPLFLLPQLAALDAEASARLGRVTGEDQGIDLTKCVDATGAINIDADASVSERLKIGLRAAGALSRVGVDPEAFEIDRQLRPMPFPGLASFGDDDADAALFYGRSREIAHTLEELRKMRAERDLRPLVILGASGAGKSSLLKAGIIPRLRREAPAWLPLRAFRPGADPLLNFAEALSKTLADFKRQEAQGTIRDRLLDVWLSADRDLTNAGHKVLEAALEAEGARLRDAAGRPGASILISVDQAEEMTRADGQSGEALADYLRVALAATQSNWQLAFTIRTDSFPELQSHRRFQDLEARGYDLRAIPVFRFDNVVVEPAKRYGVRIDDVLVDALMEDAPKEDALPLLAFALQRLWRQYAASRNLTRENYDKVGGLKGLIEDAAERALRGLEPELDAALPSGAPLKRTVDLAASTFVPALAQINDQGSTIRRVATWSSFNDEQRDLLSRFDRWRLVVRKGTEVDGGTVEVAHEALFREWNRLRGWLESERSRLEALRSLQTDAVSWDRNSRSSSFLNHRGDRLEEVGNLAKDAIYKSQVSSIQRDYLTACQSADQRARRRLRGMNVSLSVLAAPYLLIASLGLFWWAFPRLLEEYRWQLAMGPKQLSALQEVELASKAGTEFRECVVGCPNMIVIPSGRFMMGSPDAKPGADEYPLHEVTIGKPFAVGKYPVTFSEWDICVSAGACPSVSDNNWGRGDRPVIFVSWEDAKKYVAWLSRITGKQYRLLSEAEWEYVARAGTTTRYPWGEEIGQGNAHCKNCNNTYVERTLPVGSFKPNAWGVYDMHGNVMQWCEDPWHENYFLDEYRVAPADGSVWDVGGDRGRRVERNGSWNQDADDLRSANRGWSDETARGDRTGFRIARTLL